jgi:hypothetical protein
MHWPSDALKLTALPPAASDEHFELHLAAVEHGLAAPILIQSRADVLSAVHWQEQIEPYEHQMRNLITFCPTKNPMRIVHERLQALFQEITLAEMCGLSGCPATRVSFAPAALAGSHR